MPKATYHKLVQQEGDFPAELRLKVNACGATAARFWKSDQTPLGDIRTIKTAGAKIIACVVFSKAWSMASLCGVTVELRCGVLAEEVGNTAADVFPL